MKILIEQIYNRAVSRLTPKLLSDEEAWYNYVLTLPLNEQVAYTIVLFDSQIENGGFHQFFFNSYGQFAYLVLKNLTLIGAFQRANLLKRALKNVEIENMDEAAFRAAIFNRQLEKIRDFNDDLFKSLDYLDKKYYSLTEDLQVLLELYFNKQIETL